MWDRNRLAGLKTESLYTEQLKPYVLPRLRSIRQVLSLSSCGIQENLNFEYNLTDSGSQKSVIVYFRVGWDSGLQIGLSKSLPIDPQLSLPQFPFSRPAFGKLATMLKPQKNQDPVWIWGTEISCCKGFPSPKKKRKEKS